eukprot:CAMPEP_0115009768 /NCGR_PEP_ID=MMETSP0216-20121206/22857_1 /TAXON_ID=223996 /ORGANISM="Protocruzia adherens, Strain Boccale" /LENGTH=232 /DNA_ID=CAMNT_0002377735 /DNA_START=42 /DNA_END=740 /DNA_ORIENTATION=-
MATDGPSTTSVGAIVTDNTRKMMFFLKQEAREKSFEIYVKTEQEFNIEKHRLLCQHEQNLCGEFNKKKKQVETRKKIEKSTAINQNRLKKIEAKNDGIIKIKDETLEGLKNMPKTDAKRYKKTIEDLLVEGMIKMTENVLLIRCRTDEKDLIKSVFKAAEKRYSEIMKKETGEQVKCELRIEDSCLPDTSAGGVILTSADGRIECVNTIDSRLDLAIQDLIPEIRTMLYPDV